MMFDITLWGNVYTLPAIISVMPIALLILGAFVIGIIVDTRGDKK